jgi:hypothetical protein
MYSAEISSKNPVAFVFLIDQSLTMENSSDAKDEDGNPLPRKEAVSDAINSILEELVNRALKEDGIRDYFEIALIGYGGDKTFLWEGNLEGKSFAKSSEIREVAVEQTYKKEVVVRGNIVEEEYTRLTWLTPKAVGMTPMKGAFETAKEELEKWVSTHKESYPPIVINITDGEVNDVKTEEEILTASQNLQNISTDDGNTVVINIHIANGNQVVFPSSTSQLPDYFYAHLLFKISSVLPESWKSAIKDVFKIDTSEDIVGMAVNAKMTDVIKILDIGTRPARDVGFYR